jgi:excisionase family DNA binding protein
MPETSRLPDARQRATSAVPRLLEADDVARYLGMRTDWVYREVRAGRLPHIRLGRAVRFRRESIEAWLEARERAAPTTRRP